MELGINVLGWSEEQFYNRISYFTDTIVNRNLDKYIFITDVYTYFGDYDGDDRGDVFRRIVAKKAAEFTSDKVTYVPGKEMLKAPDSLSVDRLHPSNRGMREIAEGFAPIIKAKMGL